MRILRFVSFFALSILIPSLSWASNAKSNAAGEPKGFQVVIDPGHGGTDLGTTYLLENVLLTEKDITLKLAKQVAHHLIAKGIPVYLTRTTDSDVNLAARTAFANRLGADVFISIHLNSKNEDSNLDPEGVETFILNSTSDASSRRLARLENSVISDKAPTTAESKDIALILKDLRLDANLKESKRLACQVQNGLIKVTTRSGVTGIKGARRNRGVKQALFHVLLGADMPSILVEAGFLSNNQDRNLLISPVGQRHLARALAEAVDQFRLHKSGLKRTVSLNRCKVN